MIIRVFVILAVVSWLCGAYRTVPYPFNGKMQKDKTSFIEEVNFKGCRELKCQEKDYTGYGCDQGYCQLVCRKDTCHSAEKRYKINPIIVRHKQFDNCHEFSCRSGLSQGFGCKEGLCDIICEEEYCFNRQTRVTKKSERHHLFNGCWEDKCDDDEYHGYGCQKGNCDLVCKQDNCYRNDRIYHFNGKRRAQKSGLVVFENCRQSVCRNEQAFGYGCQNGKCEFICDDHQCFHAEIVQTRKKTFEIETLFDNCSDQICNLNDYHGYGCSRGVCELICKKDTCHRGDRVYHFNIKSKPKPSGYIIFEGCRNPQCQNDKHFGYKCNSGLCEFICDDHQCFHSEIQEQRKVYVKPRGNRNIIFEDCMDNHCNEGDNHGFGCKRGDCELICKKDTCYKDDRVYYYNLKAKATVAGRIVFEKCQKSSCSNDRYFGYGCKHGICEFVCDDHQCFNVEIPRHRQSSDEAWLEEKLVAKTSKESKVYGKSILMPEMSFTGCRETKCQKDTHFGYDCNKGNCVFICNGDACFHNGKPMIDKKNEVKKVNLYFDGCLSQQCFNDDFDGFGCERGKCSLVCNDKMCLDSEGHQSYLEKNAPVTEAPNPEAEFDYGAELQKIQFSKFFNFGDTPFF